jgi:lipopolysaccharide transport system ATP-binding protein
MTRKEISHKFDEIVDFAGVERYVDTPVKRYSSGMYVRLAFAVAAHLEPEILIVDEVLAVGDAEFQKKCLGKMKDVSVNDGRTVLFVSHNMGAIASLCNEVLVLQNGSLAFRGAIQTGIDYYLQSSAMNTALVAEYCNPLPKKSDILSVRILNSSGAITTHFNFHEEITIEITVQNEIVHENALVGVLMKDQKDRNIFTTDNKIGAIQGSIKKFLVKIPGACLVPNTYLPIFALHIPNTEVICYLENIVSFVIEETGTDFFQYHGNDYGCVFVNCKWQ